MVTAKRHSATASPDLTSNYISLSIGTRGAQQLQQALRKSASKENLPATTRPTDTALKPNTTTPEVTKREQEERPKQSATALIGSESYSDESGPHSNPSTDEDLRSVHSSNEEAASVQGQQPTPSQSSRDEVPEKAPDQSEEEATRLRLKLDVFTYQINDHESKILDLRGYFIRLGRDKLMQQPDQDTIRLQYKQQEENLLYLEKQHCENVEMLKSLKRALLNTENEAAANSSSSESISTSTSTSTASSKTDPSDVFTIQIRKHQEQIFAHQMNQQAQFLEYVRQQLAHIEQKLERHKQVERQLLKNSLERRRREELQQEKKLRELRRKRLLERPNWRQALADEAKRVLQRRQALQEKYFSVRRPTRKDTADDATTTLTPIE